MAEFPFLTLDAHMLEAISGAVHFSFSFGDHVQSSVCNPCLPLWLVLDAMQEGGKSSLHSDIAPEAPGEVTGEESVVTLCQQVLPW
jgi:hypothetical protein